MATNALGPLAASGDADRPPIIAPQDLSQIPALDGLRGLAVLLVIVLHAWPRYSSTSSAVLFDKLVSFGTHLGWVGVELFFVLSGFLITRILLSTRSRPRYFQTFYARRILRIFPLYYGYLLVVLVAIPLAGRYLPQFIRSGRGEASAWWYWTYLQNIGPSFASPTGGGWLGHLWSLAIEEQFYLLWPLVVWLLPNRVLAGLCVAIIVLCPGLRTILYFRGVGYEVLGQLTLLRMEGLACGGLVAIAWTMRGRLAGRFLKLGGPLFIAGTVMVLGIALAVRSSGLPRGAITLGFTGPAILFCGLLMMVITSRGGGLRRVFEHKSLRWVGVYSYGMYVLHYPLTQVSVTYINRDVLPRLGGSNILNELLFCITTLGLTMALAVASYHLYEKQFLKLKRYFEYSREKTRYQRQSDEHLRQAA